MSAPAKGIKAADDSTAEALLSSLKTIAAAERRKHATVFNYWLSIRGDRQFPPIRDLDPLEISDAGPTSVLLEMIGGGEDAEVRHFGQAIKGSLSVERISEAPVASLLSCIGNKLPIVASSRQAFAFEDEFESDGETARCWVTLLPFSANGTWIDYVYGFVSLDSVSGPAEETSPEPTEEVEPVEAAKPEAVVAEAEPEAEFEEAFEPEPEPETRERPGFSAKLFDALAGVSGFYGSHVKVEPNLPPLDDVFEGEEEQPMSEAQEIPDVFPEPEQVEVKPSISELHEGEEGLDQAIEEEAEAARALAEEPQAIELAAEQPEIVEVAEEPTPALEPKEVVDKSTSKAEGPLQTKLTEVRAKADEARMAKLRANAALYEGLSAAYDFALDAEEDAEEYLKLVEAQGLKIKLRSPMAPVVKLAFEGMCDDSTIAQLETVLAWALKQELPRGTLAERIEAEGGIGPILNGLARAA